MGAMSWVDEVSVKTAIGVGEGRGREVERRGEPDEAEKLDGS